MLFPQVSTRKLVKPGDGSAAAAAAARQRNGGLFGGGCGKGADGQGEDESEAPQYAYLVQPPDNQFVRVSLLLAFVAALQHVLLARRADPAAPCRGLLAFALRLARS